MLRRLFFLSLAGALGTLLRFLLLEFVRSRAATALPAGTFVVNMVGCFLAGFFLEYAESRLHLEHDLRIVVMVGFMGAFTTFSSIIVDTADLIRNGRWLAVHMNLLAQNFVGLLCLYGGFRGARALFL